MKFKEKVLLKESIQTALNIFPGFAEAGFTS
jgi:hypothetical protein